MLVPSTLCPLPTERRGGGKGGEGGAELIPRRALALGPEAGRSSSSLPSVSHGAEANPGTQASQKYTQIAEEINIPPPNGASSRRRRRRHLRRGSASAAVCRRGSQQPSTRAPEINTRRPGPLLPSLSLLTFYLLAPSLAGPAAEPSRLH